MRTRPSTAISAPVSSRVSRMAAAGADSPMSIAPPGSAHRSLSTLWINSSSSSLTTTAVTDGTRLLGAGASGSS